MHRFTVYIKKILKHSKAAKGQRFLRWFLANLMANFAWSYQPTLSVTSSKKQRPHSKCNHQISRLKQAFLNGGTSQNQRDEASMERKCPWWLHRMQQMVSRPTPKSFKRLGRNMWNRASCNEHRMLKTLLSCAAIHFSIAWARLHPTFSQLLLHTLQISNVKERCMLNPGGGFLFNSKTKYKFPT